MTEYIIAGILCWLLGTVTGMLASAMRGARRQARRDAPVPYSDYDRGNPINAGPSGRVRRELPGRCGPREVWIEGCGQPYYVLHEGSTEADT